MGKNPRKALRHSVSAGMAPRETVDRAIEKAKNPEAGEEEIKPENLPALLIEDIRKRKMQIDGQKEYFIERRINPYREAFEILLSFLDKFDTVAGMKAKT